MAVDQIIKFRGEPAWGDTVAADVALPHRHASRRWRRGGRISIPPARRRGGGSVVGASASDVVPTRPRKVEAHGGGPIMPNRFATLLRTSRARSSARPSGRRRVLVSACWSECCGRAQSNRRGARFFLRGASVAATQRCSRVLGRSGPFDGAHSSPLAKAAHLVFCKAIGGGPPPGG